MKIEFFEENLSTEDQKKQVVKSLEGVGEKKIERAGKAQAELAGSLDEEVEVVIWMGEYRVAIFQDLGKYRILVEESASWRQVAVVAVEGLKCWSKGEIVSQDEIIEKVIEKSLSVGPRSAAEVSDEVEKKWLGEE